MGTVGTPTRNRGRRRFWLALALVIGMAFMPAGAGAVHDLNLFELDGNVEDNSGAPLPDDWATLFPPPATGNALAKSFVTDGSGAQDSGFGSGLTKDTSDIPNWTTVDGAISPEKDDILHAYAATYVSATNQQILYFGQDRAPKPQGSTSMGFWFFQDEVAPNGAGGFTGQHQNGDILITSDMTQGGSISLINIFRWENGSLTLVSQLQDAECGPDLHDDIACGKANEEGTIVVPWDYPTDGRIVPQNIFFEGGINLSELFAEGQIPCFSSFLANTRTSPSETADLKDFVTGSINTCGKISIHKDAQPNDEQNFLYTTTGTGLSNFTLDDDGDNSAGDDATNTKVFPDLTPGDYSVSESLSLPLGWSLTNLTCTKSGPGTDVTTDLATGKATITLGLVGNVDCTYVNTFTKFDTSTVTDIHNAAHAIVTSVAAGTTVHDKATVSNAAGTPAGAEAPAGKVTFKWFTNGTCSGEAAATSSALDLSGGSVDATGFTQTPLAAGSYSFQASYAGDDKHESSVGACEPLTVTKINSTTVTQIHNAAHGVVTSVPAGTTVHDKATVSGAAGTPTGKVTFKWFTNGTCAGDAAATSSALDLSGGSVDATGFTQTPTKSGSYSFQASYAGDATYGSSVGDCEPLTVTKIDSATRTDIHNATHAVVTSVPAGTTVHDKATVTGALTTPTGSVTFEWFTNGTCTGEPADTSSSFDLAAGSVDATTFTKTPGVGGSFAFRASYGGDDTYKSSVGDCEPLTVTKLASTTTTDIHNASHAVVTSVGAGTTVHDKATVTGALGTPTGSVTFKWFTNGNCSGAAAATSSSFALASGSVDATTFAFTTPSSASGSFSFQATYSGNDTYNGSTGACEPLSSTFTPPPPPPPPAPPLIDLAVTKVDTPDPARLNGQITYTMVVTNNGPDTATQVTAADPLPTGTSFVSVSTTQGTCANNGGLIQCSIGTLAKGASATITLVVTATQTGTLTNTVTVVGKEPESNTANNTATATTLVPAPLVPPTPKPKPAPKPVVCVTFTVSTKTVTVGKTKRVIVRVKRAGKAVSGAKVRVRGAGISKTVRTGKNGVAVITVKAKRPGILRIDVIQKAACGSKRIGVVGAFEPPVTG